MTTIEYIDNLIVEVHALNDPGKPPPSQTDIINHYLNSLATLRGMVLSDHDLAIDISDAIFDLKNVLTYLEASIA